MMGEAGEEVITTGVGNGNVGFSEYYAIALHNLDVREVDDEGTMNSHKAVGRK